jgi:ubiquinone/menaquinone biosynthesis C-methylase UbiE
MRDYYLEGEERFGALTSVGYWICIKLFGMRKFYCFIVDDLKKGKHCGVLDVGTGPGYVPLMLSQAGFGRIYAIDPSYEMIKIAKRRSKGLNITYGIGSSRHIPFKGKFGVIITTLSFHHWAKKAQSLRYLSRFLEKGAEIRIYEFEKGSAKGLGRYFLSTHAVTKQELLDAARQSGLKVKGIIRRKGFIRATFTNR